MEALMLETKGKHKAVDFTVVCPYFINTGLFDGVVTRYDMLLDLGLCSFNFLDFCSILIVFQ